MYKLYKDVCSGNISTVQRLSDNSYIPFAPDNTDYQAYLKYQAEGGKVYGADEEIPVINTPLPADE
jgi:hypothetical protein